MGPIDDIVNGLKKIKTLNKRNSTVLEIYRFAFMPSAIISIAPEHVPTLMLQKILFVI